MTGLIANDFEDRRPSLGRGDIGIKEDSRRELAHYEDLFDKERELKRRNLTSVNLSI
jgi:hypothetical protein